MGHRRSALASLPPMPPAGVHKHPAPAGHRAGGLVPHHDCGAGGVAAAAAGVEGPAARVRGQGHQGRSHPWYAVLLPCSSPAPPGPLSQRRELAPHPPFAAQDLPDEPAEFTRVRLAGTYSNKDTVLIGPRPRKGEWRLRDGDGAGQARKWPSMLATLPHSCSARDACDGVFRRGAHGFGGGWGGPREPGVGA